MALDKVRYQKDGRTGVGFIMIIKMYVLQYELSNACG